MKLPKLEQILGFDQVREKVAVMAASPLGGNAMRELELTDDIRVVLSDLELISEMKNILIGEHGFSMSGIYDISEIVEYITSEDQLIDPEQLYKIASTLRTIRELCAFMHNKQERFPGLAEIFNELEPFEDIETAIFKSVDEDGEILDTASSELKRIRNQISTTENRLRAKMKTVLESYKYAGYSRDEELTIRNGRLVIPVKTECKNRVQGVVHDESASGGTVFMEPLESLEMNAELAKLFREESREIERIIRALVSRVFLVRAEILNDIELLTEIDLLYAKARFARKFNCHKVRVNVDNITNIYYGYHPLLVEKHGLENVVPLSIEIGEKFNTMVITGPNAGGKTVALKTLGLFSMMLKAGMQIPAENTSNVAIFRNIFADIGDDQSIENDLSTFSSHVAKVSRILKVGNPQTLVLLDEIGASTDPAEGAALSMALLLEFTKRKFITVATTHQGVLKSFAYRTQGIENGSMEFDRERIQPTYRFRSGIPGSSYAFEISQRHGMPNYILDRAKRFLGSEKENLEKLIADLDEKITSYNQLERSSAIANREMQELRDKYEKKFAEIKKEEKKVLKEAAQRGEALLNSANRLIENAVSEIKSTGADKKAVKNVKEILALEKDKFSVHLKEEPKAPTAGSYKGEIKAGLEVRVEGFTHWGVIEEVKGNNLAVLMGEMKFNIKKNKILELRENKNETTVDLKIDYTTPDDFVGIRLDLRGMRGDAAIEKLEKHLDQCKLNNIHLCEIVHGKGNGILDKLVNQTLEKHPLVKKKRYGEYGEGDYGVTVVELY